jgi:hypothetical protein
MSTTTFSTTQSYKAEPIRLIVATIITTILVSGTAVTGLMIAVYPAKIGFGGLQVPFWTGMSAAFLLGGFIVAAALAASDKTKTWQGMIIILVLVLVATGTTIAGFYAFGGWDWSQFWYGILELVLVAVAMGILYIYHKFA